MQLRKQIVWSAIIAVGFLIISYCVTNLHFSISGEKALLYRFELVRNYLWPKDNNVPDSILLVDVSYDKVPVETTDEYGLPVGHIQVTDRAKLLQLLQELKRRNDYKYILLDVFFGQNTVTSQDSALYATICSMPRIVIPSHLGEELADSALYEKAGLADYTITYKESGFLKYPYLTGSKTSLPLRMYEEMTGRSIHQHGFLYTDGWKVVRQSVVLTFDVNATKPYNEKGEKAWYYLGADLIGNNEVEGILYNMPELIKDKYIVIGSLQGDDNHSTYVGVVSGTLINMNAYLSLLHGHHVVSISLTVILFVAFFVLTYLTLTRQNLRQLTDSITEKRNKHFRLYLRLLSILCTWIGYSLFLTLLCISTYLLLGEIYDIFITSTLFYLLHLAVKYTDNFTKLSKVWKKRK